MDGHGNSASWEKLQNASTCLFWCRAIFLYVNVSDLLLPMSECRFTLQNEFSEMSHILPPDVLSSCDLISCSLSFIWEKMGERLITGLLPSYFRSRVQGRDTGKRHPVRQWDWHSPCTVFTKEKLWESMSIGSLWNWKTWTSWVAWLLIWMLSSTLQISPIHCCKKSISDVVKVDVPYHWWLQNPQANKLFLL